MSNNKQQTAVDSIIEFCQELLGNHYSISHDGVCSAVIEFCEQQAKEMEKEQMIDFAVEFTYGTKRVGEPLKKYFIELYNETYGGDQQ
jgi:hypothetical protein